MRCFVAIDLDNKDYFREIQNKIDCDNAKIKPVSSFHLTLKFLGEVEESNIKKIKDILEKIEFEPFLIKTTNIGVFPNLNYIRVVWVGLEPEDKINALQKRIDEGLKDIFGAEKNFKPHLTLARVKFVKLSNVPEGHKKSEAFFRESEKGLEKPRVFQRDKEKFVENLKKIKVEEKEFRVERIKLIKSTLTPEGPVYEEVK